MAILDKDPALEFVGSGRSAAVFKIKSADSVLKVFFPDSAHIAREEAEIYKILQGSPYYPELYDSGENFLLIDYIEGYTLFDCLTKGIKITESIIKEADHALQSARGKGLNPSDIHLRNIILTTEGKIKIIDVARFRQTKDCHQWDDLKKAYFEYYTKSWFPRKTPAFLPNFIAYLYRKNLLETVFLKHHK